MAFCHLTFWLFGIIDTATKAGLDAAKTTSKRVVQKTVETTEDLILIKLLHRVNQKLNKKKKKKKENETNKVEEIYIPPEKRQKIIDDLILL